MIRIIYLIGIAITVSLFVAATLQAQEQPLDFNCGDTLMDKRDGNLYPTVLIGDQCWIAWNLNAGRQVNDMRQYNNRYIEKTCYNNMPENCNIYGGLYTWHEAMGYPEQTEESRDICPEGWHVPTKQEWEELVNHLGEKDAGQQMKVTAQHEPSWDGNNTSGFTALPAGNAYEEKFGRQHMFALFWSATPADENYAWFSQLDNFWYPAPPKYKELYIGNYFLKTNGFSVRCLRD